MKADLSAEQDLCKPTFYREYLSVNAKVTDLQGLWRKGKSTQNKIVNFPITGLYLVLLRSES